MIRIFRKLALAGAGIALALPLSAQWSQAQETLLATEIFATANGERHGLAYETATDRLYTIERATTLVDPQLRAYALDGTLVSGPHALSGTTGGLTQMGLHFTRSAVTIAGQSRAAGTLVYLRDMVLHVLDGANGSVIASEVVDPNFDTGGLCTAPLNGGGKGLGYWSQHGIFATTNSCCNCIGVAEFFGGQTTGFVPVSVPGSSGGGDAKEHPGSGHLWVANATDADSLSVFSAERNLIQEFDVLNADTLAPISLMRIAFDATGSRLWVLAFDGSVYEIDGVDIGVVPTSGFWGAFALISILSASAIILSRQLIARNPTPLG